MWTMQPSCVCLACPATLARRRCGALVATARRYASIAASSGGMGGEVGNDGINADVAACSIGYGPFSATVKPRRAHEKAHKGVETPETAAAGASATVMNNVGLATNLHLRLSLAGLPHPSQLDDWPYASPEWRLAFVRLYRTILRLHNKVVAVSLCTTRGQGPEAALSAATGVQATSQTTAASATATATEAGHNLAEDKDDHLLRYLLTSDQREFGNRFVQGEFTRHMDADAVAATIFYASWYDYVLQLASGVTAREMTEKEKRLLSDEQKETLNSLRGAFFDLRTSREPKYMP